MIRITFALAEIVVFVLIASAAGTVYSVNADGDDEALSTVSSPVSSGRLTAWSKLGSFRGLGGTDSPPIATNSSRANTGVDEQTLASSLESNLTRGHISRPQHQDDESSQAVRERVVIVLISGRAGQVGYGGMEKLRDRLRSELAPLGVPESNIFHWEWNHSHPDSPIHQPDLESLQNRIDSEVADPSYLALIGHSYGGWAASRLSMQTSKVPDFVALVDPVFGATNLPIPFIDVPPRGVFIKNWYQQNSITARDTCTGIGLTPCFPPTNGLSCGAVVLGAHENDHEEYHKDWNGNRKRVWCSLLFKRVLVQSWHTMMDDNEWIWRQIRDRIYSDLRKLLCDPTPPPEIYVNINGRDIGDGSITDPFNTLSKGIKCVQSNGTVWIAPGLYEEALQVIDRPVRMRSIGGTVTVDTID